MNNNKKTFYPNSGKIIIDSLLIILAITIILMSGLVEIESFNFTRQTFFLKENYFLCLLLGVIVALIIQFFCFTRVSIEQKGSFKCVVIKHFLKKETYQLNNYLFDGKTDYKKYSLFNKRYIIIEDINENTIVKRLYGFSANGLYSLIDEIRNTQIEMIPTKEKEKIIQDSWDSSTKLELPVEKIIRLEWKSVRFNGLIFIAIIAFFTIALLFFENDEYSNVKLWVIMIASAMCVIEIPFEIFKTVNNSKSCPEYVEFIGEHLIIGKHHFIVSDIEKVVMTSLDRKSSSIYPVQRYMIIKTDMQKYKFWLGSENSGINNEYKIICSIIRRAFINEPEKVKFNGKHSLFNK